MKQIALLSAVIGFKGFAGTEKYDVIFDETDGLTFEEVLDVARQQRVMVDQAFKDSVTGSIILDDTLIDVKQIRTFKVTVTDLGAVK